MNKYINIFKILKNFYMKIRISSLKKVGKNFIFDPFSQIIYPKYFTAGNNVFIGPKAYISAEVDFLDNVMVGPRLTMIGGDHKFGVKGKLTRFLINEESPSNKIIVGKDCWIGANVTVLKGVEIGHGAVVGAGSLVTKSIAPYTIAYGVPCRSIKNIFETDEILKEHLQLLGYDDHLIIEIFQKRTLFK